MAATATGRRHAAARTRARSAPRAALRAVAGLQPLDQGRIELDGAVGLLLLDEPLAALDASTRLHVRTELRRHLGTFTGARLLVTHDPVDAVVLADRLVIIEAGRITQTGSPAEVTGHPGSRYVAELVGINLLHGAADGERTVRLDTGGTLTVADPLPGADVAIAVRPQAITLHRLEPEGSARNTWLATVTDLEADRDRVRVTLAGPIPLTAEITAAAVAELELAAGAPLWATVKAADLTVYER